MSDRRPRNAAGSVPDGNSRAEFPSDRHGLSARSKSVKVVLLQTAIGDYRQTVLEILGRHAGIDLKVFAGSEYFDGTTKTRVTLEPPVIRVRNHFLGGRRLLWQTGCWRAAVSSDVAILELNPRILSVWLMLLVRRVRRRRTLLWGHAWSRRGRFSPTDGLRNLMRMLADVIIVYSETQARELRERMPHARVVAAPNAIYSRREMWSLPSALAADLIFVGRLVAAKRPMVALDAFLAAAPTLPTTTRMVFVGDGPLRRALEERANQEIVRGRVIFTGHISDIGQLRALFSGALASVTPGEGGLSITQSFSFGVPMILARNARHGPEVEAAREGWNSVFVDNATVECLRAAMIQLHREADKWYARRRAIADDCAERYSAETMAERMLEAVGSG